MDFDFDSIITEVNAKMARNDISGKVKALKEKLNGEEFKSFLKERLADALSHQLINQQRVFLPRDADPYDHHMEMIDDEFIEEMEDLGGTHEAHRLRQFQIQFKNKKKIPKATKSKPTVVGYYLTKEGIVAKSKSFWHYSETMMERVSPNQSKSYFASQLGASPNFFHDGVLCGGAIAALVNEFLFGVPAVINDVDYFYYSRLKGSVGTIEDLATHSYEHLCETGDNYDIVSSSKENRLNFIQVKFYDASSWMDLLDSFDLNCCCVMVHPVSLEVTFTNSFAKFIDERRIEHVGDEKNFTNLIRAKRKQTELQAQYYYADTVRSIIIKELKESTRSTYQFDPEALNLAGALIQNKKISTQRTYKDVATFLAKKDEVTLQKNPEILAPFFFYEAKSKKFIPKEVFPIITFYQKLDITTNKKSNYGPLDPVYNLPIQVLSDTLQKMGEKDFPMLETSKQNYEKFSFIASRFKDTLSVKEVIPLSINLVKGNWDNAKFDALLAKISGHTPLKNFIIALSNFGWSFSEIDILLRQVMNLGLKEIGTFEQILSHSRIREGVSNYQVGDKTYSFNWNTHRAGDVIPLVKEAQTYLDIFKIKQNILRNPQSLGSFSKYIKEIITATELDAEGKRMHHCVGGYSEKVRGGRCRIFHLEKDGEHSTLEVGIFDQHDLKKNAATKANCTPYYFIQNKSYSNKAPTPFLNSLAKLFINHLYFINEQREAIKIIKKGRKPQPPARI